MTALTSTIQGAGGLFRRLDRVWLALALLFLVLAIGAPGQVWTSVVFTLKSFLGISPYLLASVVAAAWLKAAGADHMIGAAISRSQSRAIVVAAAAGALSPFCSCGVVPLIAALLAAGVPLPAVMAFWLASPIMDPEMFILMAASLSLDFTIAKTLAAISLGLMGGFATLALIRLGLFADALRPEVNSCCGSGGGCGSSSLAPVALRWAFWRDPARRSAFMAEARSVALFLAKWLMLAFAIESLMVVWLPADLIASNLGGDAWQAIPLAVVIGVPAYLNGYAAIPLIGELMAMGMAPGAALAFLVAGGVTSLPAAMAVFALVRLPVFAWYITLALAGSFAIGITYQLWLAF